VRHPGGGGLRGRHHAAPVHAGVVEGPVQQRVARPLVLTSVIAQQRGQFPDDLRDAYLAAGYSEIDTAEFDRADTIGLRE